MSGILIDPALQPINATLPDALTFHYISDEELDRLGAMPKDPAKDIFMFAIGVFFGALCPAFDALSALLAGHFPTLAMGAGAALALLSLGVMVPSGLLWRHRARLEDDMRSRIRARHKVRVGLHPAIDFSGEG